MRSARLTKAWALQEQQQEELQEATSSSNSSSRLLLLLHGPCSVVQLASTAAGPQQVLQDMKWTRRSCGHKPTSTYRHQHCLSRWVRQKASPQSDTSAGMHTQQEHTCTILC